MAVHADVASREYYGITDDFPTSQLMVRAEAALSIYFISDGVKDILFHSADGLRKVKKNFLRCFMSSGYFTHPPAADYQYRNDCLEEACTAQRWLSLSSQPRGSDHASHLVS